MLTRSSPRPFAIAFLSLFVACSGENEPGAGNQPTGSGGLVAMASGGSDTASGGLASTGGQPASGGQSNSGGSGGAVDSGGGGGGGGIGGFGTGGLGTGGDASTGGGSAGGTGGVPDATGGMDGSGGASNQFDPCPTDGSPCKILPLGDSITEGYSTMGFNGGYRVELFRQALANGKSITFVGGQTNGPTMVEGQPFPQSHQGHGGYTISGQGGIAGEKTNIGLSSEPHIILLMIGTNDINGNIDTNNAPDRLRSLVNDIVTAAPDSLLALASIIPIDSGEKTQQVLDYNVGVESIVTEFSQQGDHVIFVDNYDVIESQPNWQNDLMGDYLHPNTSGYNLLGDSFYQAISGYLH